MGLPRSISRSISGSTAAAAAAAAATSASINRDVRSGNMLLQQQPQQLQPYRVRLPLIPEQRDVRNARYHANTFHRLTSTLTLTKTNLIYTVTPLSSCPLNPTLPPFSQPPPSPPFKVPGFQCLPPAAVPLRTRDQGLLPQGDATAHPIPTHTHTQYHL